METVALIVAAGRGQRLGSAVPKQYLPLGGLPLLRHSAAALAEHAAVAAVRVVIDPAEEARYRAAVAGLPLMPPVAGGASRQESVRLGLESLAGEAPVKILIHDGARPFPEAGLVDRVLAALDRVPGAVAALPLADTLKRAGAGNLVEATLERRDLWRAQTPQGFRFGAILEAHRSAAGRADLTDDAAVAECAGLDVALVQGSEDNIKVTTADDLALAERILGARQGEVRVGTGYDVHRFGPGDGVMLCGVRMAHDRGLVGHSDADVALHAVTDALLGALGEGDIGAHFPPSDAQWRGAPSHLFVEHAARLLRRRGGALVHVDVTIVCEAPKLAPHRAAMRASLAAMLGVAPDRISVKATTTEGLGFTGRREGIAAQAAVTVRVPPR